MFLDQLVRPDDAGEWFLCGPREMIEAARSVLLERGVATERLHAELFHAKDAPRPARDPAQALLERPRELQK